LDSVSGLSVLSQGVFQAIEGFFYQIVPVCVIVERNLNPFLEINRLAIGLIILPPQDPGVR
jgi:hypothetical protein